ncbi:MAG: hypothetical protein KAV87_33575 [Desulfobacteraceae bacterium]|nr:hypothetical protein [Desulfobacteraceae bacterium]
MKVRVKKGQKGFIYGSLRTEGKEFTLKDVEHSTELDENGDPLIISAESQFSKVWMEKVKVTAEEDDEPVAIKSMKAPALKEACKEAGIDYEGMDSAIEALEDLEKSSNPG